MKILGSAPSCNRETTNIVSTGVRGPAAGPALSSDMEIASATNLAAAGNGVIVAMAPSRLRRLHRLRP